MQKQVIASEWPKKNLCLLVVMSMLTRVPPVEKIMDRSSACHDHWRSLHVWPLNPIICSSSRIGSCQTFSLFANDSFEYLLFERVCIASWAWMRSLSLIERSFFKLSLSSYRDWRWPESLDDLSKEFWVMIWSVGLFQRSEFISSSKSLCLLFFAEEIETS